MPKIDESKRKINKDSILKCAEKLFYQVGYNRTSVNDIIKEASISKGRFYTYFKSKEDLFFTLIHKVDKEIRNPSNSNSDLGSYIEFRLKRFFADENRIRAKYALEFWSSSNLNIEQRAIFTHRYKDFKEDVKAIIEGGQSQRAYKNIDSVIHVLMSTLDGIIMLDSVLYQPITDEIIQATIDIFTTYLKEAK